MDKFQFQNLSGPFIITFLGEYYIFKTIFSSRKLKRVLELPSENWFELAQDWCCHGSSHLTSLAGDLDPSEDDCFVGEYFIRVHPAAVETNNLKIFSVSRDK